MNIHLPAILGFTRYQGFDPSPYIWMDYDGEYNGILMDYEWSMTYSGLL